MNYLKFRRLSQISLCLTLLVTSINLKAQFEVYPSAQNYSVIDLNVLGNTTTMELHAIESLNTPIGGSILNMYRYTDLEETDRTVSLRSSLAQSNGVDGSYGSLSLSAYVNTTQFFNADNVGVKSTAPYAMISLAKHQSKAYNSPLDYAWYIGVFDEFEWDETLEPFAPDEFDCQDCLTFAHAASAGAAVFYKFSFGSDGDMQTASDLRLKKNIVNVNESLDKIMRLDPKKYDYIWNDKTSKRKKVGFLAQEVQEIFPDLVSSIRQPTGEKTLMLNYQGLIPHLAKGMQEQQSIIEKQSDLISVLTKRIAALESKL